MYNLTVDLGKTPHGEERVVLEGGIPLAVALVDINAPDFTLAWTPDDRFGADPVMNEWLTTLLPSYGIRSGIATLEFYLGNHFHQEAIPLPASARAIRQRIQSRMITARDEINFLLINAQNNVFEACFGPRGVCTQVACIHTEARLQSLIPVFKPFHSNHFVRSDLELTLQILGDDAVMRGALNLLNPVPVIP